VLDRQIRTVTGPSLERIGGRLAAIGVSADFLTAAGWLIGVGACVAAALAAWYLALVLWLANRVFDGIDGPVARAKDAATERGGYLDVVADFSIYGGFVVAVAVAEPSARLACVSLLFAYYVSGTALLALSSLLEKRRVATSDDRSLRLTGGLAEGFETIIVYSLMCLWPGSAAAIAWVFAGVVTVTAIQRVGRALQLVR
jgi:phosphatidylglycerophosphate synthase